MRRVDVAQQRFGPAAVVFGVVKKFGDDNAGVLVSNLAFSAFFCVFPLLLLLVTVLNIVLAHDPGARNSLLHSTLHEFPVVGNQLGSQIHGLQRSSVIGLVVGLLGLLWGSTGLAQSGLFSMSQVWNLPGADRPNFVKRLGRSLAFLAVLGSGLVVTTALAGFGTFGRHNIALGVVSEGPGHRGEHRNVFRRLPGPHTAGVCPAANSWPVPSSGASPGPFSKRWAAT